jgi:hypothetical protein
MNYRWRSYVLQCIDDDPDCKICEFIRGVRTEQVMLAVIERLDAALADERRMCSLLMEHASWRGEPPSRSEGEKR